MRFKPRNRQEQAPKAEAVALPRAVAEALDKATLHERAPGEGHHRVVVTLPGQPAFFHEGQDESAAKLLASMALSQEQAKEAAKRLDARIKQIVRASRRERRAGTGWVNDF